MICNEWCRPDVVMFGESIDSQKMAYSLEWIKRCSPTHIVVVGTSLQFPYLKQIIDYAKINGAQIVNINPGKINASENQIHYNMNSDDGLKYFYETHVKTK